VEEVMPGEDDDKKKPEDELEEDDLELEIEDDEEEDDEGLEVDLEEEDEKAAREEKERNKAFASMRIENKELKEAQARLEQQVASMSAAPAPKAAPVPDGIPKTEEEWDALAEKDWKKAVDLRSNMNAQHVIATNNQASQNAAALEKAKSRVLERHPELNDNSSEKSKIFLNILNNNPDYVHHPNGPIYAMRDMEEHMETVMGYKREDIVSAEKKGAQRESVRQHRIVLNKGGGKIPGRGENKVTLTKDESEFCKIQGIDPKEFAKTKKKLNKSGKEGVSV
jgi:hypothetical protein